MLYSNVVGSGLFSADKRSIHSIFILLIAFVVIVGFTAVTAVVVFEFIFFLVLKWLWLMLKYLL